MFRKMFTRKKQTKHKLAGSLAMTKEQWQEQQGQAQLPFMIAEHKQFIEQLRANYHNVRSDYHKRVIHFKLCAFCDDNCYSLQELSHLWQYITTRAPKI